MTFDSKYNINKEMDNYLEVIYEILIDLDDIKDALERGISIRISSPHLLTLSKLLESTKLSTMSTSSSSDSYSTPTLIPSPQELSSLITDPYTNEQVDRKFRNKPTSSAILRYYTFISHTITELEGELERHQQEREILYDNLFTSRTFKYKIRPIVEEYRHRCAMR